MRLAEGRDEIEDQLCEALELKGAGADAELDEILSAGLLLGGNPGLVQLVGATVVNERANHIGAVFELEFRCHTFRPILLDKEHLSENDRSGTKNEAACWNLTAIVCQQHNVQH
jgi:hypothetical protein